MIGVQTSPGLRPPRTEAVRAVQDLVGEQAMGDYLFLEAWEGEPTDHIGSMLRVWQIRRANPELAAQIRAQAKATFIAATLQPSRVKPAG